MNQRVVYRPDGTVAVLQASLKARREGESDQDLLDRVCLKIIGETQKMLDAEKNKPNPNPEKVIKLTSYLLKPNYDYDDIDPSTLPPRKDREKWRGNKTTGLIVDNSIVTDAEKRQTLEEDLDAELAKPTPNAVKAIRLQRKLEKRDYS